MSQGQLLNSLSSGAKGSYQHTYNIIHHIPLVYSLTESNSYSRADRAHKTRYRVMKVGSKIATTSKNANGRGERKEEMAERAKMAGGTTVNKPFFWFINAGNVCPEVSLQKLGNAMCHILVTPNNYPFPVHFLINHGDGQRWRSNLSSDDKAKWRLSISFLKRRYT